VSSHDLWRGRLTIAAAALLWGLSGFFVKLLTQPPTWLGDMPPVAPQQIACWRCLLGAAVLAVFLRPAMIRWHPLLPVLGGCGAAVNLLFVFAMAQGGAAEVSLLQYTAPLWVFLVNVWLLKRARATRRDGWALFTAMLGVGLLVAGSMQREHLPSAAMSLGAGVVFGAFIIVLDALKALAPVWVSVVNLGLSGLIALPFAVGTSWPHGMQWLVLIVFAIVQVALPTWLMTRGLQSVPAHEASLITLLDPICSPVWAYFITGDVPPVLTWCGGSLLILALVVRYLPGRVGHAVRASP
jgi:drug/metabolite transporter (DMT)-like permease